MRGNARGYQVFSPNLPPAAGHTAQGSVLKAPVLLNYLYQNQDRLDLPVLTLLLKHLEMPGRADLDLNQKARAEKIKINDHVAIIPPNRKRRCLRCGSAAPMLRTFEKIKNTIGL
jgi:hypothetical protein